MGDEGTARKSTEMTAGIPTYEDVIALIHGQLASNNAAFSIGVMGAIGEYFKADSEPQIKFHKNGGTAQTWGGGISINLPRDVTVTAYESVSGAGHRWTQGVLFSYPKEQAALVPPAYFSKTVLREIGPDKNALGRENVGSPLFDLGVGVDHFSFGIRIENKNLEAMSRDVVGIDLFSNAPNVLKSVMEIEPNRVVQSKFGRIEATNPFMNLDGPHTHIVPSMFAAGVTHAATLPVPDGHVLCLTLHPQAPWVLADGRPCDFNRDAYDDFQIIFDKFGPYDLRNEKRRLLQAIQDDMLPADYIAAASKPARLQARAVLRQLQQIAPQSKNLKDWFVTLDRTGLIV